MNHIVLFEPEKPANVGNIIRTCMAMNAELIIVGDLSFELSDKSLKRAGMDYWYKLSLHRYLDYEDFLQKHPEIVFAGEEQETTAARRPHLWFATTKAQQCYSDVSYGPDDYIMFGKESAGIPEEILVRHPKACVRIPMWGDIRSLNLSNSVAIVLYEALRQNGFENLSQKGSLHHLSWEQG